MKSLEQHGRPPRKAWRINIVLKLGPKRFRGDDDDDDDDADDDEDYGEDASHDVSTVVGRSLTSCEASVGNLVGTLNPLNQARAMLGEPPSILIDGGWTASTPMVWRGNKSYLAG